MLQSLNLYGLCKYDNSHQAYLFEHSKKPLNCSYILVFLKQSTCYTVTPDTHQWYRTNTNEITDSHNITVCCNGTTLNMALLPTAEPFESNASETIVRLILSQDQRSQCSDIQRQVIPNISILCNYITQSHDQFTVILQQFSIITAELKNFTNKVPSNITKLHRHAVLQRKVQVNS